MKKQILFLILAISAQNVLAMNHDFPISWLEKLAIEEDLTAQCAFALAFTAVFDRYSDLDCTMLNKKGENPSIVSTCANTISLLGDLRRLTAQQTPGGWMHTEKCQKQFPRAHQAFIDHYKNWPK